MPKAKKIKKIGQQNEATATIVKVELKTEPFDADESEEVDGGIKNPKSRKHKQEYKVELQENDEKETNRTKVHKLLESTEQTKRVSKKRQAKKEVKEEIEEEEEEERMDIKGKNMLVEMVRTAAKSSRKLLGAHVSAQGGPENAIKNAIDIGCQAFALFIRNQRRWESKPMEQGTVDRWNETIKLTGFPLDRIIPHGSYLLNPGSPDPQKLELTRKAMLDECQRCERLGIGLYNFHPGSTTGIGTKEDCLARIAESINFVQERTKFITLVVETMCGSGNTVGNEFSDMRKIIQQVRDKGRVGVCIDTCHTFAAGYDLTGKDSYERAMEEFEKEIGFKYLKAVHLNDSGGGLSSRVDRHRNIGKGHLGDAAFQLLMRDPRFDNIPMVLETPVSSDLIYTEEMDKLYKMEHQQKKE